MSLGEQHNPVCEGVRSCVHLTPWILIGPSECWMAVSVLPLCLPLCNNDHNETPPPPVHTHSHLIWERWNDWRLQDNDRSQYHQSLQPYEQVFTFVNTCTLSQRLISLIFLQPQASFACNNVWLCHICMQRNSIILVKTFI